MDLDLLQSAVAARQPRFLADLERLVSLDCGSRDKAGVDAAGRLVEARLAEGPWAIEVCHLSAPLPANDPSPPVLLWSIPLR